MKCMLMCLNTILVFSIMTIFSACNGQVKTEVPKNSDSDPRIVAKGLLKILKPENLFKEAAIGCGFLDQAGNLWFGSNGEGVYCYDGNVFTHFTEKDGLDNNIVYAILEDNAGNIWVGTKTGLNRLSLSAGKTIGKTFTQVPIVITNPRIMYSVHRNPPTQNGV